MIKFDDPMIGRAAMALFGRGTAINDESVHRFEKTYNCIMINAERGMPLTNIYVEFDTEQDELMFRLKWSGDVR